MDRNREKKFVVISLGSSQISGMIATKLPNGRINPIKTVHRRSNGSIVHGCIHNIAEVSKIVGSVLDELSMSLDEGQIRSVYVGLDAQSMRSHTFQARLQFGQEGVVLDYTHLDKLSEQAYNKEYPGHSVLYVTEPRYFVDGRRENKPNGVRCRTIDANYQVITVRKEVEANVYEVFETRLGFLVEEILVLPIAEAQVTLSKEELVLGCAYINMGGGTTSISLYQGRLLTGLYVLPLGGINVTKDLTHLRLLEQDAEQVKLKYGSMDLEVDKKDTITAGSINGTGDKILSLYEVNSYIHARMQELTSNVITLIQEIDPDLQIDSLVFSGGAVRLRGYMDGYISTSELAEISRYATARPELLHESASISMLADAQSLLGLVAMASNDCLEYPIATLDDLMAEATAATTSEPKSEEVEELIDDITIEDEQGDYDWDNNPSDQDDSDEDDDDEDSDDDEDDDDDDDEDDDKDAEEKKQPQGIKKAVISVGRFIEKIMGGSSDDN